MVNCVLTIPEYMKVSVLMTGSLLIDNINIDEKNEMLYTTSRRKKEAVLLRQPLTFCIISFC